MADQPMEASAARRRREYLPAAERRRRITLAAQQVFARSGLKGTRTRDLAKAAKINQATLFSHFSSKEELFAACVLEPLQRSMREIYDRSRAFMSAETTEARRAAAESSGRQLLEMTMEVYPLLAVALFSDVEEGQKFYLEHIFPLIRQRAQVIAPSTRAAIDPEFASLTLFGTLFAIAMDRAFRGGKTNVEDLARQLVESTMFGISADPRAAGG